MPTLLSDDQRRLLVDLLRAAFPHDTFPMGPYERAAQAVVDAAAANPRLQAQLLQGLDDLDRQREVPFSRLDPDIAAVVLRGIADTPFFTGIVDVAVVALYDDHEVWDVLGYEGASYDKGGYIDRGFNDLDWLPDPRIESYGDDSRQEASA
ncbi:MULTISPECIES: hypothetical protein [Pseudonocardia]|uniref:Uncharacterized protein n=2 Tax=Pseudonocardia TaxID=1847 RepID=A0A1Y2MKV3_PSEAH|nr:MULTISPECIES: hypothetical protein [Pseudonocardia]OSY35894.1 hypothetical protein BG845_05731 [Pseudonocardia autotrophica]TDN73997.1 hypothetical protein C8E95_3112 [Pseudonocardia autotrophica]BBG04754.1 hypothetical protein Pdca_59630 [Pseudonocardia autotrophica]GEC28692.1 hypothetical protein PSA01_57210 [Pseudonocardia saturnea]